MARLRVLVAVLGLKEGSGLGLTAVQDHKSMVHKSMVQAAERIAERWELGSLDFAEEVGLSSSVDARVLSWEPRSTSEHPLAWCSACETPSSSQLTLWCGPLTDCPHLFARVVVDDETLRLTCDFRPRLDGGYDDVDEATGEYNAPASREAFSQKATREDYAARYFRPDVASRRQRAAAFPGATAFARPSERVMSRTGAGAKGADSGSPIAGPLFLDVELPRTDEAARHAVDAVESMVETMLSWLDVAAVDTATASSWMTSRLVYDRDCLVRAKLYASARSAYGEWLDAEDALALAIADAGKLDMVGHNSLGLGRDD